MAFHATVRRPRSLLSASPKAHANRAKPARLGVEALEDRLALSTVSLANRILTYQADAGEVNALQISLSGNTFTFAETGGVAIRQGDGLFRSVTANSGLFDHIIVNLGDRNDLLTVLSNNRRIDALGEDGSDTITIGAAGCGMEDVIAPVVANGGTNSFLGRDRLVLADCGAPAVTPGLPAGVTTKLSYGVNDSTFFTRQRFSSGGAALTSATVFSRNIEVLTLNASNQADLISVASTAQATPVEINAGGGNDDIRIGTMQLLAGRLAVRGEAGVDRLTITDTTAVNNGVYLISTDSVTQGAATVDLATMDGLTINAPNKVNTFNVFGMGDSMPVTLRGGALADTVFVSDPVQNPGQIYILGAGQVTRLADRFFPLVNGRLNYSGVDRLVFFAGRGDDTFWMTETALPSLTIFGGDGVDTIDYSAFTTNVEVNLPSFRATKVAALLGFENATGGAAADILVGNDEDNVLAGKAGRDVLIGGRGADTLLGGEGEDIMIAGQTTFDGIDLPMNTVRDIWAGPGTAAARVNSLKNGAGSGDAFVMVNDNTVLVTGARDDGARDLMRPFIDGTEDLNTLDWFWANPGNFAPQDQLSPRPADLFN